MGRLFVAVLSALLLVSVGCQNGSDKSDAKRSGDAMKASADACTHCPGVQKATSDGKCPVCGMDVSKGAQSAADKDICTHCAGVQTANAEGKCPVCSVAAK